MQHYSERLLLHVKRAEQATQAAKEAAVREVGITAAQQAALAVLSDNPGINTAELARRCGVTQQTMNSLLSRMELRGFVRRAPHPLHGSLVEIKLTAQGRAVFEESDALVDKLEQRLTDGLSEAEVALVRDLLGRIAENAARVMAQAG
ncbi:MarR family winged helix-turn-helix transcriptional regulator [Actinocrinis sp.]|uniref:MarR family winged helix-turn-helix transcriptional regulator n=1 Tax=Actinocrinis sp. TaxID=1920516 RepID=UPI002D72788C|nr:MarR family transcriptional regulator [Actinocrinis sp.]HZP53050.1 MarR family transcriptional regulator [Actinocrinis sp.]